MLPDTLIFLFRRSLGSHTVEQPARLDATVQVVRQEEEVEVEVEVGVEEEEKRAE